MTRLIVDSDRHCPHHHQRLLVEVGQDDVSGSGETQLVHFALCCEYREFDRAWKRKPVVVWTAQQILNRRLSQVDRGVEVPMRTDLPGTVEVETWA